MEQGAKKRRERSRSRSRSSSRSPSRSPTETLRYKLGFGPKETSKKYQKIARDYEDLIGYIIELNSRADPGEEPPFERLIEYLEFLRDRLLENDKEFIINTLSLIKNLNEKQMEDFIKLMKKIYFDPYFDKNKFLNIQKELLAMNKTRDLTDFNNAVIAQITKKFYFSPEIQKEMIKGGFIDNYLTKQGYIRPDEDYNKSRFAKIVLNYEEGKEKEYKELVKNLADIIARNLELKEEVIPSIIPKIVTKKTKELKKFVSTKIREMKTGKKTEEDVYTPKKFLGPASTKRLYEKVPVENMPSVLGDETIKVKGVKDLGLAEAVDLNVHIFNDYKKFMNTIQCLRKAVSYCANPQIPETQKTIPCILYHWNEFNEAQRSASYLASSIARLQDGHGYIVTRDFSKYIKLSDFPNFENDNVIVTKLENLLRIIYLGEIYHGGDPNKLSENILINPDTKDVVLVHFEQCNADPTDEELKSQIDMFKSKNIVPEDFSIIEKRKKEEVDISQLQEEGEEEEELRSKKTKTKSPSKTRGRSKTQRSRSTPRK
jgi:hypothetical protein